MRVAPLDWRRNFTIGGAKRSRLTAIAGTATRNDRTKEVRTAEGRRSSRRKVDESRVLPHLRDNDTLLSSLSRPLRLTNPLNINTQSPHPFPLPSVRSSSVLAIAFPFSLLFSLSLPLLSSQHLFLHPSSILVVLRFTTVRVTTDY